LSRLLRAAALPLAVGALAAILSLGGDGWRATLQYDRHAVAAGEYWRLLTAQLVHLGPSHLAMNLIGLALLWALFGRERDLRQWLAVLLGATATVDAGLWWLAREVDWYVGLSGVLHGVWAAAGVALWSHARRDGVLTLAVLAAKLTLERAIGPLGSVLTTEPLPVVTLAHVFGATGGLIVALLQRPRVKPL
jgi:rhomboid family GlyGly-CTERM serine protease